MTLRVLFNAACGLILTFSLVRAVFFSAPQNQARDPRTELTEALERVGFRLEARRTLVAPEAELIFVRDDCSLTVVFMPTIHRISIPAQSAVASMSSPPKFLHAGQDIGSLSGATVIPRWLMQRLRVNFQLTEDSPWTSIVLAVHEAPPCRAPMVEWDRLR